MQNLLENPLVVGIGAGVVGLFVGSMLSTATINSKIENGVKRAMAVYKTEAEANAGATADTVAALTEKLTGIETTLGTSGEKIAGLEKVLSSAGSGVMSRMDSLESNLTDAISSAAASTAAAVARAPATPDTESATAASDETAAESEAETAVQNTAVDLGEGGPPLVVGQTAIFVQGYVRAFVQSVDADAGSAVLSVNGTSHALTEGQTVEVAYGDGSCNVGVASVSAEGVSVASDCDGSAASADSEASDESDAGATEDQAATDGSSSDAGMALSPGQTAVLVENELHVFSSGVINDKARLAINGTDTVMLAAGESTEVAFNDKTCTVNVTGIEGATVSVSGGCE